MTVSCLQRTAFVTKVEPSGGKICMLLSTKDKTTFADLAQSKSLRPKDRNCVLPICFGHIDRRVRSFVLRWACP